MNVCIQKHRDGLATQTCIHIYMYILFIHVFVFSCVCMCIYICMFLYVRARIGRRFPRGLSGRGPVTSGAELRSRPRRVPCQVAVSL